MRTDRQIAPVASNPTWYFYAATYHESGVDGWDGPTGSYAEDMRAPLGYYYDQETGPHFVGSKTWTFYMWWDPSNPNPLGGVDVSLGPVAFAPSDVEFTLTYVRAPQGPPTSDQVSPIPVDTSIDLQQANGALWTFPAYDTSDGRSGYEFQFTATLIPEPSSLFALGCPLLGLAGLSIRRRGRGIAR